MSRTPDDRGKYVVVYQRQPDGTLKLAVDSATSDGSDLPENDATT
jgi:ketosteroid isomerase-like protein